MFEDGDIELRRSLAETIAGRPKGSPSACSDTRNDIFVNNYGRAGRGATMPPRHAGPLLMVALAWALLAWSTPVTAASKDARAFVERVNEASVNFFSSGSEAEARERCRALLAWAFDVPAMGKEALGRAWGKATEEERKEFLEAFEEDIISAYLRRMRAKGTTLIFIGHRPPIDGNELAASRRSIPGKEDQIWIWWMRPDGQSWRIVDLLMDGHSAVSMEVQEYATVLERNNGDMNALIAFMRKRAAN
jgi:phospholipid transport system substrate-binding protein